MKLNFNQVVEIKKLYNKGLNSNELSSMYKVSPSTIRMITSGKSWVNIGPKIKKPKVISKHHSTIFNILKSNPYTTYQEIADKIGISCNAAMHIIYRYKDLKELKKDGRKPPIFISSKLTILSLYSKGYSQQQIGLYMGLSQPSISNMLISLSKELNFKLRKRPKIKNYDLNYIRSCCLKEKSLKEAAIKLRISECCLRVITGAS